MEERFAIKRKDFKKLERYAENIYNTAVVIDYFCSSQKEYELVLISKAKDTILNLII